IHVIPADASAVASINLNSLADKAGVNDKQNEGMKQRRVSFFPKFFGGARVVFLLGPYIFKVVVLVFRMVNYTLVYLVYTL
ncbi:DUF4836 family protein, partial [Klebsiella pneumoniae]|uniref:DUF4836 family protein n=1 Tax=Klebsiella pneumoniae TaxID=573 RepID=UPI003B5AB837